MNATPLNYLITGEDDYIKEAETRKIRDQFLSSGEVDLNYSVFGSADIDKIMDSVGTLPFLAEKRVVVVKELQLFTEEAAGTLVSYLEKKSYNNVLVITASETFRKTKHFTIMSKLMSVISADKPDQGTAKNRIKSFFKKEGIDISSDAVDLIVELKGTDSSLIKLELEKLACFSGGEKIEYAHVEKLVGRSITETVFKLVDAINEKNPGWAFSILNDLYEQKKQPPEIIGYLSWYTRIIQKIKLLQGRGVGHESLSREMGYSPAYTRRLAAQAGKYSVKKAALWATRLLEADQDIKTGKKQPQYALEMLLAGFLA
ncbi:MAG: DNA polymerase III subunit delta [Candidatus Omnitrophota bacterium]